MAIFERVKLSVDEYLGKLKRRGLDANGRLVPDPVPVAPPLGYKRSPSMVEMVREMVRSERLRQEVEAAGFESFEEAEDFDVEDEVQLHSPYENDFDPSVKELMTAGQAEVDRKKAAAPPADGPGAPERGQPSARKGKRPEAASEPESGED